MRVTIVWSFVLVMLSLPAAVPAEEMSSEESIADLLSNLEVKGEVKRLWGGNDVKYVLRLEDGSEGGLKVVFRPEHHSDKWKHRKEVASYRLALLCGIDNVPVTVRRTLPKKLFRKSGKKTLERIVFRDGMLEGALQLFVTGAHDPTDGNGLAWAKEYLAELSEPAQQIVGDLEDARQFSRLVVFDFLQSNPDRFSGGNLLRTDDGTYWFIDNADAYYRCYRPRRFLRTLSHFERHQIEAMRSLSEDDLRSEMTDLLGPKQAGRVWERLQKVLVRVDGLIAEYGEEEILF